MAVYCDLNKGLEACCSLCIGYVPVRCRGTAVGVLSAAAGNASIN